MKEERLRERTILYLHGFNSGFDPCNDKVMELGRLGKVVGVEYDSFASYEQVMRQIEEIKHEHRCTVYVGTSLGGYYAAQLAAQRGGLAVVVNPAENPYQALAPAVGHELVNFKTGEIRVLSEQVLATYQGRELRHLVFEVEPLLLLDDGDELLDVNETVRHCGHWPMVRYAGGCHRFAHMAEAVAEIGRVIKASGV